MNRRSFFTNIAKAAVGFAILPTATTYARNWKPVRLDSGIYTLNPEWVTASHEISFIWHPSAVNLFSINPSAINFTSPAPAPQIRYNLNKSGVFERVQHLIEA